MSHDLFDQTLVPRTVNRGRRGTVIVSLALHAAALAIIVVLQFTANVDGPQIIQPLVAFVAPVELPTIPVVTTVDTSPRPAAATVPTAPAPTVSPDHLPSVEPSVPPSSGLNITSTNSTTNFGPGDATDSLLSAPPPPPSAGATPTVVRVGGQIAAPARLYYRAPIYPRLAQTARVDGTVILEATIDERGAVRDVRVTRSIPLLDQAAVDAVNTWRYTPTRLNGVPVPVVMTVSVSFSLRQ